MIESVAQPADRYAFTRGDGDDAFIGDFRPGFVPQGIVIHFNHPSVEHMGAQNTAVQVAASAERQRAVVNQPTVDHFQDHRTIGAAGGLKLHATLVAQLVDHRQRGLFSTRTLHPQRGAGIIHTQRAHRACAAHIHRVSARQIDHHHILAGGHAAAAPVAARAPQTAGRVDPGYRFTHAESPGLIHP